MEDAAIVSRLLCSCPLPRKCLHTQCCYAFGLIVSDGELTGGRTEVYLNYMSVLHMQYSLMTLMVTVLQNTDVFASQHLDNI